MPLKPTLAMFDARVFNIPQEEVSNYFLARQKDAVKNSVAMLAQSLYSHKELHKKNGKDMQEMCFQKGHNWNDLHWSKKRGSLIEKNMYINDILVDNEKEDFELGDIYYQPDVGSSNYPSDKGRLLVWSVVKNTFLDENNKPIDGEDFVEVKIEKIRNKWELVETPMSFSDYNFPD